MSHVVVRCPSCRQKYRVDRGMAGKNARCRKCQVTFLIASEPPLDEDAIVAWITEGDPMSKSVLGSTGIFEDDFSSDVHGGGSVRVGAARHAGVRLQGLDASGARFLFPAGVLAGEEVRNAFPRKCVGCGAKSGLHIHLVHWPERLGVHDGSHVRDRVDRAVGRLEDFEHMEDALLLKQLPHTSHVREPFTLPFPVFACPHCRVSREVQAHVEAAGGSDYCKLTIVPLTIAVDFFRTAGGRDTHEYRRLVEARDLQHDPWRELSPVVRQRLSQWLSLHDGEKFVGLYSDAETSAQHAGAGGIALTTRRLLVRKASTRGEYALAEPGRLEIVSKGDQASVHIYEGNHAPAVIRVERHVADDLAAAFRKLRSGWAVMG